MFRSVPEQIVLEEPEKRMKQKEKPLMLGTGGLNDDTTTA